MPGAADGFSPTEGTRLPGVCKGLGPTVVASLGQQGHRPLAQLAEVDADDIGRRIADPVGSADWRNSPQARMAIETVLAAARGSTG